MPLVARTSFRASVLDYQYAVCALLVNLYQSIAAWEVWIFFTSREQSSKNLRARARPDL